MSHSAPAPADTGSFPRHPGGSSRWELVPLPPITYHVKTPTTLPSKGDGCCVAAGASSPAGANADSATPRKRKRPLCLSLPATVGREFLVRSTLSACDRCNVVGRKRIKRDSTRKPGEKDVAGAAADITSTLCQRCQNIYNGGKYLSKQMARFDLMAATADEDDDGMGRDACSAVIRLSASSSNAVAIQINKKPINTNDEAGTVEATVKQGDVVSFLLNPRGVRDEKDCAVDTHTENNGKKCSKAKEEEFWSMRFSVVQSQCFSSGNDDSHQPAGQRKDGSKDPDPVLNHADCSENTGGKKGDAADESPNCNAKGTGSNLSDDHADDNDDCEDHEELDETPVLSMHHFSATQWQNQSAMDITSVVADTPYTYDDEDDGNDSDSNASPALGGMRNDSFAGKRELGCDQDSSSDENNGRDLSSFSLEELKKMRDKFSSAGATSTRSMATATGVDPTPASVDEISASFHRALFSMVIRLQEKGIVQDDRGGHAEDSAADRATQDASSGDEDEEGNVVPFCDQEVLLPKLLEYTTIE